MKTTLLSIFAIAISFHLSNAQSQGKVYEIFNDAVVNTYGNAISAPFCGGLNSYQIQHADLNNDNKKDLILYDQNNKLLKTFLNTGIAGQVNYIYAPQYEKNFPTELNYNHYLILKDYNCDGIPDLFHNGNFGVTAYKGFYQNNELKFTFYKNVWARRITANDSINAYVQNNDIPSIEDADGDGDLDILAFDVQGVYTVMHKNMRVEYGLPCDSLKMEIADKCWGKFFQTFNREVYTNSFCTPAFISNKKKRHTGNCILQLDIDGDGDMDLMGGNISFNDAQLLFNNGSNIINAQDTNYNITGHKLYMPSWPAPFHCDIDNDGDDDLLFTSHNDDMSSANYNTVAWYKNTGNAGAPNYIYAHDSLLATEMIDVGSYSYPTFFDFDKDGKKDLFVGTEGYLDNATGILTSKIAFYKNTSTIGNTSFQLITHDFLNLSTQNHQGIFPTFGDITGDGIDDLIFGGVKGNIALYKNTASSNLVQPVFVKITDSLPNLKSGEYSTPVVVDFNQDGKNDLFVGSKVGKIAYFEDTSSTSTTKLALKTTAVGNIKAGSAGQFFGYSAPFIGKIDNTDSTVLLIGNVDGNIERYDSFINNYTLFNRLDSNYSFIQASNRAVPAVADIDGDGKYEMVIGNKMGGLYYYKQVKTINPNTVHSVEYNQNTIAIFPNPCSEQLQIVFKEEVLNKMALLNLYDMMGRKIVSNKIQTTSNYTYSLGTISKGIYFLEIEIENQKVIKKILKN